MHPLSEVGEQLGNCSRKVSNNDFQKEDKNVFSHLHWLFSSTALSPLSFQPKGYKALRSAGLGPRRLVFKTVSLFPSNSFLKRDYLVLVLAKMSSTCYFSN